MSDGWKKHYTSLRDFMQMHPDIVIEPSRIAIPKSIKNDFYALFNAARKAFIENKYPNILNDCLPLINGYKKIKENIIHVLELEKMTIDLPLDRFMVSPIDELSVDLFHPIFDLLKGKIDLDYFEITCSEVISNSFQSFFKSGYELWVMLSLIQMLEPEKMLAVSMRQPGDVGKAVYMSDQHGIEVPPPQESKYLNIDMTRKAPLMLPDIIISSKLINKYISFRQQFNNSLTNATNTSDSREWIPLESDMENNGSILIYIDSNPDNLALVGDTKKICRPDILMQCICEDSWANHKRIEAIYLNTNNLCPKLGSYIITPKDVPFDICRRVLGEEPEVKYPEKRLSTACKCKPAVNVLVGNFDSSQLLPVMDMIIENNDVLR